MNFMYFITVNQEVVVCNGIKINFDLSENNQRKDVCYFSNHSSGTIIDSFIPLKTNVRK